MLGSDAVKGEVFEQKWFIANEYLAYKKVIIVQNLKP
jgi:hypothetical protein